MVVSHQYRPHPLATLVVGQVWREEEEMQDSIFSVKEILAQINSALEYREMHNIILIDSLRCFVDS